MKQGREAEAREEKQASRARKSAHKQESRKFMVERQEADNSGSTGKKLRDVRRKKKLQDCYSRRRSFY